MGPQHETWSGPRQAGHGGFDPFHSFRSVQSIPARPAHPSGVGARRSRPGTLEVTMKSGSFGKWSLTLGVVLIAALGAGAAARNENPAVTAAAGARTCP